MLSLKIATIFISFYCTIVVDASELHVIITGDTSVVLGGTFHLTANTFELGESRLTYEWRDVAIPQHNATFVTYDTKCTWNLTYDPLLYSPGNYTIRVRVSSDSLIPWYSPVERDIEVEVRSLLSGYVSIAQGNTSRNEYVSTNGSAEYSVALAAGDAQFVNEARSHVVSYWFLNCTYLGPTAGLSRTFNFSKPEERHYVEVIVVASVPPPTTTPPPTTSTTQGTTSTTTVIVPTTTASSTPLPTPTTATPPTTTSTTPLITTSTTQGTTSTTTVHPPTPSALASTTSTPTAPPALAEWLKTVDHSKTNMSLGKFCLNISEIAMSSPESTYGYFKHNVTTKAPVASVQINGSNWLQEGEFLKLGITCQGSPPFTYCVQLMKNSSYNVTGHEKCDQKTITANDCTFVFGHLLPQPKEYKLLFIISNHVNKLVTPVGVIVYKVAKQPQLSIIIVPIASAIVASILIIFGIAYYLHTRRTYTIEVADFDFGQQTNDMEYKTFSERLREAVLASFFRTSVDDSESNTGWSPTRKYGSMQE